jgi:CelD/BcsL family acetyltransferase involved in cellulose biosynthesis
MLRRTITPLAESSIVPEWWVPLFIASSRPSVFVSAEWMQTWLDVYGAEFEGHWVCWDIDGVVVGGCLIVVRLVRKALFSLRSLYFNATGNASMRTPLAEFNDVLFVEKYRQEITADLVEYLQTQRWDRMFVSGYERGGVLHSLLGAIPSAHVQHEDQSASYVDLTALEASPLEATLSSNTRGQLRRSMRGYEEQCGPLRVGRAKDVNEALSFLGELASLHNSRRSSKGEAGSFESAAVVRFHQQLVARLFPRGEADLLCVSSGTAAIGYLYNFVQNGKVYFFQSGFRYDSDAKMKPGLLTHALAIERYAAEGQREYDFLAGDSQYKRSLAKQTRTLHWSVAFRDKLRIRTLLRMRNFVRRVRR